MGTYARAGLAAVLAFGALLTVIRISQDGSATATTPPRGPYVALGDSYTAGPKIPGQTGKPAGCDRSDRNYPALVAQKLNLKAAAFRDVSCSGATTADLSAPQSTGNGVNRAQFSALSGRTRLVTLGIGGNDIGFSSLITQCVKRGVFYLATGGDKYSSDDAPCKAQNTSDGTDRVRDRIQAAGQRLARALSEIKRRAPQARVYVVGYPAILPSSTTGCGREMALAPGDVSFLREKEQQLNDMLRRQAQAAGAGYVDTYAPSADRDACSASDTRWIEPLIPLAPAAPVHPNARGERGMADAVLSTIGAKV
ncbi:SGNH/GDSL hydrolase family protein [Streptomyces sp. NBC_01537]|uniref:SGNH/GDSL hydrolase family protein n=1 Tax=Streptomyces sp. NBC_01537 TaxID=2903896 RepID=UPI003865DCDA